MKFRGPVGDVAPNPLIFPKDNDRKAGSSVDRKVRLRGLSSLGNTKQEIETGAAAPANADMISVAEHKDWNLC